MTGITNGLYDVFFIDTLEGWVAGSEVLFHTVDGGENWVENTELDLTGKTLTALWFNSPNEGYTVSNKGTLYKYTEITTGVKQEFETIHFEIFPNPAAGKFRVQCSIVKVENATIELYDLTGKKLLEKPFPAGTENAEIDVSHLKNGVYFCRLISEKYSAIQKLIIQKYAS